MKERPILFSAPMVRAILARTKTQTRRIVKPPRGWADQYPHCDPFAMPPAVWWWNGEHDRVGVRQECPYGQPGDQLWVRESHAQVFEVDIPAGRPVGPIGTAGSPARPDWKCRYVYRADGEMPNVQWHHVGDRQPVRWAPSIHMPRIASRITLEITGVRVERLQEISEEDAKAEGAPFELGELERLILGAKAKYRSGFVRLWESINGDGSWDENPWVWCVEFQRIPQPTPTTPTGEA